MSAAPAGEKDFSESSINIQFFLLVLMAMLIGLLAAILLLPSWLPNMAGSLVGESPKAYWYLSRATAFVSLTILWISMALGLGLSNRLARLWPGAPAAFAIHEYVSLLGLAFAAFHALLLLGDRYIDFTVAQILIPFATVDYRPTWVGIGQIGFYAWLIVALSFYVRASIGQKTWRLIHYLSFGMYLMGLVHGLFGGTDSTADWARGYYWISGGSLLFLSIYRIVNTLADRSMRKNRPPKQPPTFFPRSRKENGTAMKSDSVSARLAAEPESPAASATTVEDVSHRPASSPAVISADSSDAKAASSTLVKKYELGSGENRINVRIYKEPPAINL